MTGTRKPWNPVESASRDELRSIQWKRLVPQIAYDYERSPFYRRRFDELGIKPQDIRSWDDFRRIPTMNKHDHRRAQEESVERFGHPYGTLACAPLEKFILVNGTSGTTGTPTLYTMTENDRAVINELQARKFWRIGLRPGDRVLHGMALSMFTGGLPLVQSLMAYGACPIPVGAEVGSRRLLETAALLRPRMLCCTPSYAEHLAEKCPEIIGCPARELGFELIFSGAEPGAGLPEVRSRIEAAYGAKLYDTIGAAHTFHGVSCDLPDYQGLHFLSEDYCVLELLDTDTKQVLEIRDGAIGEMVFTYLGMEGTPLLRYALGDVLQVSTTPCDCGWPGLRFKILGRADDMLIVKGVNVYPAAIRDVVAGFAPRTTGQVRVLLDQPGPLVKPPLRLLVEHGLDLSRNALSALVADLKRMLHEKLKFTPDIDLVSAGTLERSSHKTKLVEIRPKSSETKERGTMTSNVGTALPVRAAREAQLGINETNLVCMSGQGSVQTLEIMAQANYVQHGRHVSSVVFPGNRSKSTPVVSYLKVSDRPIASMSTNFNPTEVVVFWEGLLRVASKRGHEVVADAVTRLRRGALIVNTAKAPDDINVSWEFEGTIATVDASRIAREHLKRNPPPVGIALLGAYARVTGALDMDLLMRLVLERLPGNVGERNVAAAREAYAEVRIHRGVMGSAGQPAEVRREPASADLPEWLPIKETVLPGHSQGSAYIWREKIPVCDDTKCLCPTTCLSEAMCPDTTGFIVRAGIKAAQQGYRVDTDYCRGCGQCATVCVHRAITMVNEEERLRAHPGYAGVSVAPYRKARSEIV